MIVKTFATAYFILVFTFTGYSQFRYLKIKVDSSYNLHLQEANWLSQSDTFPSVPMTSWTDPEPLEVTGDDANWRRYYLYDDDLTTTIFPNSVSSNEEYFHENIIDLGEGNEVTPDSLILVKPSWSFLQKLEVYMSNDYEIWDKYLDTIIEYSGSTLLEFPLNFIPDTIPPSSVQNLIAKYTTYNQSYLLWDKASDNDVIDKYYIYLDNILLDSTKFNRYIASSLDPNNNYEFTVSALDRAANESIDNDTISITTTIEDNTPPMLSGTISNDSTSHNMICISWPTATDDQLIDSYVINIDTTTVAIIDTNAICIPGLMADSLYQISVRAKDINQNYSSDISINISTSSETVDTIIIGTNFWRQQWSIESNQLFVDGYQNVVGPNPWKSQLLNEITYAKTLRFMEMQQINELPEHEWLDRQLKEDIIQEELAYEWMIDLCNRNQSNLHICLPNTVISAWGSTGGEEHYIQKLAILLKTGIDLLDINLDQSQFDSLNVLSPYQLEMLGGIKTTDPLDPHLRIYIEYGNENWNANFPQSTYCATQGGNMGLDFGEGWWVGRNLFSAYASTVLFDHFEKVFDQNNPRVLKLLPIRRNSIYWTNRMFEDVLQSTTYNPSGVLPDHISGGTYFGNQLDGSSPFVMDSLCMDIDQIVEEVEAMRQYLNDMEDIHNKYFGLTSYEGGHHVTANYELVNNNPEIYNIYLLFLESLMPHYEEIILFSHVATNAFGLKSSVGQHIEEAHKYRAVIDFLNGIKPIWTNKWIGDSGFWHDSENWSLGHVPTAEEHVLILSDIPKTITILENENFSCRRLRCLEEGVELDISGHLNIIE